MNNVTDIGTRREVCWDEALIERADGVSVKMHRPEPRGLALVCDKPWEGNVSGYFQVMDDCGLIRLYYRGCGLRTTLDGEPEDPLGERCDLMGKNCYAESADGKTFVRPDLGIVNYKGSAHNNIFLPETMDNFCVFRDGNPACPPEERYKGLAGIDQTLRCYVSADGVHFASRGALLSDGAYDSMNLAFWDKTREQYFVYYRGIHRAGETDSDGKWHDGDVSGQIVRDVRVRTSKDFRTWSAPRRIAFAEGQDDYQLYTSQIQPYYRAPHVFLGMPTRYTERLEDKANFKYLPDRKNRLSIAKNWGRSGYAMTDCILVTSRDGYNFRRTDEAFLTPGPERDCNWYYGDCYPTLGLLETAGELPGAPRELSLFVHTDYRVNPVRLMRWAVRIDGFFSWSCGYKAGSVLTKPFVFGGAGLEINFATSCLGYVRIRMCGEDGAPIPGYDSGRLFGDSLDRPVDFEKSLAELAGKPVRMLADMSDAELYSFKFDEAPLL